MMIRNYITLFLLATSLASFAQKVSKIREYQQPVMFFAPFGHDQKSPEKKDFDVSVFFETAYLGKDDAFLNSGPKQDLKSGLRIADFSEDGLIIPVDSSTKYSLYRQKLKLNVSKYDNDKISVYSNAIFRISRNGETLIENLKQPDSIVETGKTLELLKGDHPLLVQILAWPGEKREIQFKLQAGTDSTSENFEFVPFTRPSSVDLETIVHLPGVTSAAISSDGKTAALTISRKTSPKGKTESWIELWDLKSKALMQSFRGLSEISSVQWVPGQNAITYTSSKDKEKMLWLHPLDKEPEILIEGTKEFSSYKWSPDGTFLIFTKSYSPEKKDKTVNLLDGMASRLPGYEKYSYLYRFDMATGKIQQLTFGKESTSLNDISPDGSRIIFTTSDEDYSRLPYSYSTYWLMDLASGNTDSLFTLYWGGTCKFLHDGDKLIISGGPGVFGEIGINVEEGQVANGYDGQAYIYDLKEKKAKAITKNLDPSVSSFEVSGDGKFIYFITSNKTYQNAFRYSIADEEFVPLKGRPELVRGMDLSKDGKVAVATGNNTQSPSAAYLVDLKKMQIESLYDPSEDELSGVQFGDVRIWNFKNENGDLIDGRYYLPPDFDSTKTYPLIVYYYGGTTPVSRSFGGRYPYNWYAAQGYVVYIPQPRGCIGYGQKFSAEHVNNWGKTTALDIIDGTKKFLDAHKFVNPEGVGCIGASYGGFMTMYLLTQTDIFSAAVSHAGISSLSSYWGEGYWGYAYSAVATQGSFPWNRKDIYVDQSPLFQADKVNTPLLLTHGTSDTNVPPGESYQFYTALKLLGKDVEMLEVPGQDHWILDYEKYFKWKYSIIAWFDKHLKKEPNWWNEMYD